MGNDNVKRILVWEKVADFLMDIAKYVLTAVFITTAFEDIGGNSWLKYGLSAGGAGILLIWSLLLYHYKGKKS
mgnify:FL=1